ncbi:MAG: 4-hydroxy-tetrahydrodipicolinate synthase [Spirochaetia bacterium]|nr:4-hydroxy-tetrahydrodipicolinate synthase [Spirochaetia bacterium]
MKLQGTFTALITPFQKNEQIDYPALKKLIVKQMLNKVEGLVPCGTTGESPTLTHEEHREVIAKTVEWAKEINKDTTIIAGTGSNSTQEAVDLTKSAAADGADYALVVNPYYNKPTQDGLYAHFMRIAESSTIPVIVYNIPGRTSVSLSIDTISRLAEHPNIAGIKESTGDLGFMAEVILNTPDDFVLLSGDDNLLLPVLSIGGKGVISVLSNLLPLKVGNVSRSFFSGNYEHARKEYYNLLPLMKAMFFETNPIPVKAALSIMSEIENVLRLPMTKLSKGNHEKLINILTGYDNT